MNVYSEFISNRYCSFTFCSQSGIKGLKRIWLPISFISVAPGEFLRRPSWRRILLMIEHVTQISHFSIVSFEASRNWISNIPLCHTARWLFWGFTSKLLDDLFGWMDIEPKIDIGILRFYASNSRVFWFCKYIITWRLSPLIHQTSSSCGNRIFYPWWQLFCIVISLWGAYFLMFVNSFYDVYLIVKYFFCDFLNVNWFQFIFYYIAKGVCL